MPVLSTIRESVVFAEVAGPAPCCRYVRVEVESSTCHIICFHSPLLYLIHSSFSKAITLLDDRPDLCVPEHDHLLKSDEYSDVNLLAALFNDIEVLCDDQRLYWPIKPRHLTVPYDYCEFVAGARRFLLAHELGHVLFRSTPQSEEMMSHFIRSGIPSGQANAWAEELWCDQEALWAIMDVYGQLLIQEGDNRDIEYEIQNTLNGIILMFAISDFAEIATGHDRIIGEEHPPFEFRLGCLGDCLVSHPLYNRLSLLKPMLQMAWWRVKQFRTLQLFRPLPWIDRKLSTKSDDNPLSPFGFKAYLAIREIGPMRTRLA